MPIATTTPGASLRSSRDYLLVRIDFQSQMAFATKYIMAKLLLNPTEL